MFGCKCNKNLQLSSVCDLSQACKEAEKDKVPRRSHPTPAPATCSDVSLLDMSSEDANADVPVSKSSSELLHEMWKESGLENSNFNPLEGLGLEGLTLESADMSDKKDSPEALPSMDCS